MRKFGRVDKNHKEIAAALKKSGCKVLSLAPIGGGVPDLLCLRAGKMFLIECKTESGSLTPLQRAWFNLWPVGVARSVDEALAIVGLRGDLSTHKAR